MNHLLATFANAKKHVGAGRNVNLFTLARNGLPAYCCPNGWGATPLTIFLSINSVCNLRCKMCDIGQRNLESSFYRNLKTTDSGAQLTLERLQELAQEVCQFRPKPRISVTTTEPFLYKQLFDVVRLFRAKGMEFQVTTNGSLLREHIDEVFDSGITELGISLDGAGPLHDSIRGMDGLYDNVMDSLRRIREIKERRNSDIPKISIATTISNFNFHSIDAFVQGVDPALYDQIILSHMNFIDDGMVADHNAAFSFVGFAQKAGLPGDTDNRGVDVAVLAEQIRSIKAAGHKVKFAPDFTPAELEAFYLRPDRFVRDSRCYIPWVVMEILANGDVIPLTRCIHLVMGNIHRNSVREIWNGSGYRTLRQQLRRYKRFPICRRCRGIL